jgi:hypothetical protein
MQMAYIYKREGQDCSNGGISSRCNHVMAFGANEPFDRHFSKSFGGKPVEAVRLTKGNVSGSVVARPIDPVDGEPLRGMAGGCFIASSDSRFWEMVADIDPSLRFAGAVPLHDRFEF